MGPFEVDGNHPIPKFRGVLYKGLDFIPAGVVYQKVNLAEGFQGHFQHGLNLGQAGDIRIHGQSFGSRFFHQGDLLPGTFLLEVRHNHVCSQGGKLRRDPPPAPVMMATLPFKSIFPPLVLFID
jgi:hypothetical protein